MIRYKIVSTHGRKRLSCLVTEGSLSKNYRKGSIVKANRLTAGIATFKTKKQAKSWLMYGDHAYITHPQIIRVKPIGKGKEHKEILRNLICFSSLFHLKGRVIKSIWDKIIPHRPSQYHGGNHIDGSIWYPAVEVLD